MVNEIGQFPGVVEGCSQGLHGGIHYQLGPSLCFQSRSQLYLMVIDDFAELFQARDNDERFPGMHTKDDRASCSMGYNHARSVSKLMHTLAGFERKALSVTQPVSRAAKLYHHELVELFSQLIHGLDQPVEALRVCPDCYEDQITAPQYMAF